MEEVPSKIHEGMSTFRFTWVKDEVSLDSADQYLRQWLFTDQDEAGRFFLIESLLDHPDESEDIKKEKAKIMREKFH